MRESARSIRKKLATAAVEDLTDSNLEMLLQIANERADRILAMREAYLKGEIPRVLELVRELCDIPAESIL